MDANRNSLVKLSQVGNNASANGKTETENSLECGLQIDFYLFELLIKHDLSLDIIVKNIGSS